MAHSRGTHTGSFAKGFIDALLAGMKLEMMRMNYEAREKHYATMDEFLRWKMNGGVLNGKKLTPAQLVGQGQGAFDEKYGGGGGGGGGSLTSNPFLSRLIGLESNGINQVSKTDKDSHGLTLAQGGNPNEISQGYFQIQNYPGGTWSRALKNAGIDINQYPTPRSAPYEVQLKAAITLPLSEWGGRTKIAMKQAFPDTDMNKTVGELASQHGSITAPAEKPATTEASSKENMKPTKVLTKAGGPQITGAEQADLPPSNQFAGGTEEDQMAAAIEENRKLREQQNIDSPAPAPGGGAPQPKRSLPIGSAPPGPTPPRPGESISAIPPGPTVAAQQDRPQALPPESDFPLEYPLHAVRPEGTVGNQPTFPTARPDAPGMGGRGLPAPPAPIGGGAGNVLEAPRGYQPIPIGGGAGNVMQGRTMPARPQSLDPMPPPIIMGPPQRTGAPPNVGPTPSSVPDPVQQMGPEGGGRTTLPGSYSHMPPQQNVRGQTAVGTSTSADKPSPDAQNAGPLMRPTRGVSQPGGLPPGVIRYEVPNSSASRAPIYTAADLSHMWGSNPPVAQQRAQAPSAPAPSFNPARDSSGYAGPPPSMDDVDFTGAAKGGPIQKFNKGGIPQRPVTKFAGGGQSQQGYQGPNDATLAAQANNRVSYVTPNPTWVSPTSTTYVPPGSQPSMGASGIGGRGIGTNMAQGYKQFGGNLGGGFWSTQAGVPYANPLTFEQVKSNLDTLTPEQQAWYGQQLSNSQATIGQYGQGASSWMYNPASYPMTPAPAAPAAPTPAAPAPAVAPVTKTTNAPVVDTTAADPSTTTGTGVAKVPDVVKAKSYDPNVDATTGAGFANTDNAGGTNYTVGVDDKLQADASNPNQISGFARGGIPSKPTLKFATGGAAPTSFTPTDTAAGGGRYLIDPNYVGPGGPSGWIGSTPYSALAPNQQAWADTTRGILGQALSAARQDATYWGGGGTNMEGPNPTEKYWSQITPMPNAVWPDTPAPVVPIAQPAPTTTTTNKAAPTVDTQNQAGTGIVGVPDVVTGTNTATTPTATPAKTFDPNVIAAGGTGGATTGEGDWANTGGTNYAQNPAPQIGGFRKGGGIPRSPTLRVRYDDGGGVSPSALGPPPALAGGQQPIPPYYYNPATYSPAGAPVGKGVSHSSAPTYIAGAIPSLPMARGGIVRFDDGGTVEPMDDMRDMDYSTQQDDAREQQVMAAAMDDKAPAAPVLSDTPPPGGSEGYYSPEDLQGQQPPPAGGAAPAAPEHPSQTQPPTPVTPEVTDGQGNPSKGFIAALTSGLHWLAQGLGLAGGAQAAPAIAASPQQQQSQQQFVQGNLPDGTPGMTKQQWNELGDQVDPTHSLQPYVRNVAAFEYAYKMLLYQGREPEAAKMAATMLHYSQQEFQAHAEQAAKLMYDGHAKEAVDAINEASDALIDGRHIVASLDKNGQVMVTGTTMDGRELWKQIAGPNAIMHYLNGAANGSLGWTAFESQAAKYDGTYHDMAKARAASVKQRGLDADESAANAAFADKPDGSAPASTAPPTAPTTPPPPLTTTADAGQTAPAIPPTAASPMTAATQGAPLTPDGTATAQVQQPPPDADQGGVSPVARGPSGHGGALPSVPGADVQPVASEQPAVDFDKIAASLNNFEQTRYKQIAQETPAKYEALRKPMPDHSLVTSPTGEKVWRDKVMEVKAHNAHVDELMKIDIDGQRRDLAVSVASQRAALVEQQKIAAASKAADVASGRATAQDKLQTARTEKLKGEEWAHTEAQPLTHQELLDTFKEKPPSAFLTESSFSAVNKADGSIDDNASAQKLGQMFDLNDRGGIGRINTLSTALWNTQAYNKHLGPQQTSNIIVGMANGTYGYRGKPAADGTMQVEVYRGKVGQGVPTTLRFQPDDYDAIGGIHSDFVAYNKPTDTTGGPNLPAGNTTPPPPVPLSQTTVRPAVPMIQSTPGLPPRPEAPRPLTLPSRVPNAQVPQEWKDQFPELTQ